MRLSSRLRLSILDTRYLNCVTGKAVQRKRIVSEKFSLVRKRMILTFAAASGKTFFTNDFPVGNNRFRVVAQPGSALVWGARGRWFESSPPDKQVLSLIRPVFTILGESCLAPDFRDVAQPGSALRSGRRGRWFESSHPDQVNVRRQQKPANLNCGLFVHIQ